MSWNLETGISCCVCILSNIFKMSRIATLLAVGCLSRASPSHLVGVPTLSQKQVLGSSIFASWGGTHRAQKTKNITGRTRSF
jgi:hypothetical protein